MIVQENIRLFLGCLRSAGADGRQLLRVFFPVQRGIVWSKNVFLIIRQCNLALNCVLSLKNTLKASLLNLNFQTAVLLLINNM